MINYIVTFTPYFKKSVINELIAVDKSIKINKEFSKSHLLIESNMKKDDFLNNLLASKPIFIKHICPVEIEMKIDEDFELDKTSILNCVLSIGFNVKENEKFAVQTRIIGGGKKNTPLPYSSKDIEVFIGEYFTNKGGIPTFSDTKIINKNGVKILSIFINSDYVFIGFSKSEQNLNFSCDEYLISTKHGKRVISRAENKLIEALAKYNINFNDQGGVALDVGAAPGGWTKVLANYGFEVVAVDPGDLHQDLKNHPKITHHKNKIEDLVFKNSFDIIVNDMNVDPKITSEIMNLLASSLKNDGLAIITFKLPNKPNLFLKEGLDTLSIKYDVISVNSLFHNRQEVTVLAKKKKI